MCQKCKKPFKSKIKTELMSLEIITSDLVPELDEILTDPKSKTSFALRL